jgi:hypothetical protein
LLVLAALALVAGPAFAQAPHFGKTGTADGRFGASVTTIGDIDGDGVDDIVAGEPEYVFAAPSDGRVLVYSGRTGALLRTSIGNTHQQLGTAVTRMGDLNGDGVGEYAVGAPGYLDNQGAVFIYDGATGSVYYGFGGPAPGWGYGRSLTSLGDVDGDGLDDLAIGAPDVGVVDVYSGGTIGFLYGIYDPSGNAFGAALARCGDLDNDGVADFLIGQPKYDAQNPTRTDAGRVSVRSGRNGGFIMEFVGDAAFDELGTSLAVLGDVDHDHLDDFAAGAPGSSALGYESGLVRTFSGGARTALWTTYGSAGDELGRSLSGIGDMNRDGFPDCIAGTPDVLVGGGAARVLSGRDGRIMYSFLSDDAGTTRNFALGTAVAGGDFNHDGIGDVAIGDPSYGSISGPKVGQVTLWLGCPAAFETYGTGWPGKLGVPTLTTTKVPAIGAPHDIQISNSLGSATPGLLMLGLTPANITLPSGASLLLLPSVMLTISIPKAGLTVSGAIPYDFLLCFLDLYEQVLEVDPFAVGGVSFTRGLHLTLGFAL